MKKKISTYRKLYSKYCLIIVDIVPNLKNEFFTNIENCQTAIYRTSPQKRNMYIFLCEDTPGRLKFKLSFSQFKNLLRKNGKKEVIESLNIALEEIYLTVL
jgi:hypothetical protein